MFAAAKIDEQMLGEKARGDHARAVVDEARTQKLARRGIDHRIAGAAVDPGEPVVFTLAPGKILPLGPEGLLQQRRPVEQRRVRELAPQQFVVIDAQRIGRQFAQRTVDRVPHRAHR